MLGMPCVFKPTVDMKLSIDKARVCAYIFNPKLDTRLVTQVHALVIYFIQQIKSHVSGNFINQKL